MRIASIESPLEAHRKCFPFTPTSELSQRRAINVIFLGVVCWQRDYKGRIGGLHRCSLVAA